MTRLVVCLTNHENDDKKQNEMDGILWDRGNDRYGMGAPNPRI